MEITRGIKRPFILARKILLNSKSRNRKEKRKKAARKKRLKQMEAAMHKLRRGNL